jgi:hypothetical protein
LLRHESTLNNIVAGAGDVTVVTVAACAAHATWAPTTTPASTSTTTTSSTTSSTTTPTTTSTVPPAVELVFSVQPSNTAQGANFSPAISVSVRDASNNIVTSSSVSVTLAITAGTGSPAGRLTCTTNPKAASGGVVTFGGCSISKKANGYTLTATSSGLTNGTSSTFNIT